MAYACMTAMLVGVLAEYIALSVMIPMGRNSDGSHKTESARWVTEKWEYIADLLNLSAQPKTWFWIFLFLLGIRGVMALIQAILNTFISKRMHSQLSSSTFKNVVSQIPMREIYGHSVGYYMSLAGDDSIRVGQLFYSLIQSLAALLAAFIGLVILYVFSVNIFYLMVVFLLACTLLFCGLVGRLLRFSSEASELGRQASTIFVESINGLRSIRSMGGEIYVGKQYKETVFRYARLLYIVDVFNHSARTLPGLILLAGALFFLRPSAEYFEGVTIAYLFVVTTLIVRILTFLSAAVFSIGKAATEIRAVTDLKEIIKLHKAPIVHKNPMQPSSITAIKVVNLSCGYGTNKILLKNVNLEITPGKSYVLMGNSGVGKSTFSDVLLGLMPPISGYLVIGGQDYSAIDVAEFRQRAVLVEQQSRIFSGTIRENISFGAEVSDGDMWESIKDSELAEFILSLPQGVDTILEYQGANLSGGQRQRIGIARALVRQPDLLILDEATSALDVTTKNLVVENLLKRFSNKILIFITHDEDLAYSMDEIWKIENMHLHVTTK